MSHPATVRGATFQLAPTSPSKQLGAALKGLKAINAIMVIMLVAGCVSQLMSPTVSVMPAPAKPFSVFEEDQAVCKQFAEQQVAGGAAQTNTQQVGTAVVGTALGAGLGAAIGGGRGADIGVGTGAIAGMAVGEAPARQAQLTLQKRYDIAYEQCMYARGNQVPGFQPNVPPSPATR